MGGQVTPNTGMEGKYFNALSWALGGLVGDRLPERDPNGDRRALGHSASDADLAPEEERPLAHAEQPEGGPIRDILFGDSPAVVGDRQSQLPLVCLQADANPGGVGVPFAGQVGNRACRIGAAVDYRRVLT